MPFLKNIAKPPCLGLKGLDVSNITFRSKKYEAEYGLIVDFFSGLREAAGILTVFSRKY